MNIGKPRKDFRHPRLTDQLLNFFLANPDEELKLRDPRHQARYAESIADGIKRYFSRNPPLARG